MWFLTDNGYCFNIDKNFEEGYLGGYYAVPNAHPVMILSQPFLRIFNTKGIGEKVISCRIVKDLITGDRYLVNDCLCQMTMEEYLSKVNDEIEFEQFEDFFGWDVD